MNKKKSLHHHIHHIRHKLSKHIKKLIALSIFLFIVLVMTRAIVPQVSADATNPLKSAKLDILVQNPYNEKITTEFPDGRSFVEVNINAYNKDGSPLIDQPLIVDMSSSMILQGPATTGDGHIVLKFASNKSVSDNIRVKLKNCATVRANFKVRFASDTTMTNITDKNSFVQGSPLTLQVQIKPWMTGHISSMQAKYIYTRRINKWGFWVNVKRVATENMTCSDGICQATFGSDYTSKSRNDSGVFTYQFTMKDSLGKTINSKAFKSKLRSQ